MKLSIFIFFCAVYTAIWLLKRHPRSWISRTAFTWIGPRPVENESWARFQLRWALYSFEWLCQFSIALSALILASSWAPAIEAETWFSVWLFALPLAIGVAVLACSGFLVKAAKARFWGPNPTYACLENVVGEA